MLFRAFAQLLRQSGEDVQLVLIGHEPMFGSPLRELAASLGLNDHVVFCGYVSDDNLSSILRHASIFVFPSKYEGFGIPILEAMEAGIPVACSNVASLPEVAGKAALYFDPQSSEQIMGAIKEVLNDEALRNSLIMRGFENLKGFSWLKTSQATIEIYKTVLSQQVVGSGDAGFYIPDNSRFK